MLLRLAYLGVGNAFALLRLLAKSDRDKDAEILALRHQLVVLQRQLGPQRVSLHASDLALLACDFFETVTLSGARLYVFTVIEHASRGARALGATAHRPPPG